VKWMSVRGCSKWATLLVVSLLSSLYFFAKGDQLPLDLAGRDASLQPDVELPAGGNGTPVLADHIMVGASL